MDCLIADFDADALTLTLEDATTHGQKVWWVQDKVFEFIILYLPALFHWRKAATFNHCTGWKLFTKDSIFEHFLVLLVHNFKIACNLKFTYLFEEDHVAWHNFRFFCRNINYVADYDFWGVDDMILSMAYYFAHGVLVINRIMVVVRMAMLYVGFEHFSIFFIVIVIIFFFLFNWLRNKYISLMLRWANIWTRLAVK